MGILHIQKANLKVCNSRLCIAVDTSLTSHGCTIVQICDVFYDRLIHGLNLKVIMLRLMLRAANY